jgi:hypothetical protein
MGVMKSQESEVGSISAELERRPLTMWLTA